jgi:hypothetical protein
MKHTHPELTRQLKILHIGGIDAARLFLEASREAFGKDSTTYLDDWVTIARPALDEETTHAVMCGLLRALFGDREVTIVINEPRTLN